MRKDLIFDDREAEFLRELVRQKVDFMIVGLSAAALQGAPVVTPLGADLAASTGPWESLVGLWWERGSKSRDLPGSTAKLSG